MDESQARIEAEIAVEDDEITTGRVFTSGAATGAERKTYGLPESVFRLVDGRHYRQVKPGSGMETLRALVIAIEEEIERRIEALAHASKNVSINQRLRPSTRTGAEANIERLEAFLQQAQAIIWELEENAIEAGLYARCQNCGLDIFYSETRAVGQDYNGGSSHVLCPRCKEPK
jgi:hypothetical protein